MSYRLGESRIDRLTDARNVFSIQNRLETRHGMTRFNTTSLSSAILSLSFFKNDADTRKVLAKADTFLYDLKKTGASTKLKTGLTSTTKHRAITMNRGTTNRQIIAIEQDGLFSYNGTTFTQLGVPTGAAPTVAIGSGSLTDATYQVGYTFEISSIGMESNISAASASIATTSDGIDVSVIPSTNANALVDKVNIYLQKASGDFLFVVQINLGTTTHTIDADPTSTQVPPIVNAPPPSGGGRFLTEFDRKLIYAGNNTEKSTVFFSERDLPDAYDDNGTTHTRLYISGNGPITGIITGLYFNTVLDPYLVIFKRDSTWIYSEIGGNTRLASIEIGGINHETAFARNGDIFFQSKLGWHVISNGAILRDNEGNVISLDRGDLNDLYNSEGYTYQLNTSQFNNFFAVHYKTLDQGIWFVAEGANTSFTKAYVFQFGINGFTVYDFKVAFKSATMGESDDGDEQVLIGDDTGIVFKHSIKENRDDVDEAGASLTIPAFAILAWVDDGDMDSSSNYGALMIDALSHGNTLTVKSWINFDLSKLIENSYKFPAPISGFILDESKLDIDTLSDGRDITRSRANVFRAGTNILIGFYMDTANSNMGLLKAQLDIQKHGNPNTG